MNIIHPLREISLSGEIINYLDESSVFEDFIDYLKTTIVPLNELQFYSCSNKVWNGSIMKIHKSYDTVAAKYIGQEIFIMNQLINGLKNVLLRFVGQNMHHDYNIFMDAISYISHHYWNRTMPIEYVTIAPDKLSVKYILPLWSASQPKFTFLPRVLDVAKSKSCRIIVLFDHESDWSESISVNEELFTVQDVSLDVMLLSEKKCDSTSPSILSWVCVGCRNNTTSSSGKTISEIYFDLKEAGHDTPLQRIEELGIGFHCAILRCAGWKRGGGMPPQDVWDGLLSLYHSALADVCSTVFENSESESHVSCSVLVVDCGAVLNESRPTHWGVGSRAGTFLLTDICTSRCAANGSNFTDLIDDSELSWLYRQRYREMREDLQRAMQSGDVVELTPLDTATQKSGTDTSALASLPPPPTVSLPMTASARVAPRQSHTDIPTPAPVAFTEEKDAGEWHDAEVGVTDDDACESDTEETDVERRERMKSARMLEMVGGMMHHDTMDKISKIEAEEEAVRLRKLAADLKYTTAQAATIIREMSRDIDRKRASERLQRRLSAKGGRVILPPLPPPTSISILAQVSEKLSLDSNYSAPFVENSVIEPSIVGIAGAEAGTGGHSRRGVSVCIGLWELIRCAPQLCVSQIQYKAVFKTLCRYVREHSLELSKG